jgi:hypothetical protein
VRDSYVAGRQGAGDFFDSIGHQAKNSPPPRSVGRQHRPRPAQVRHALPSSNQGDADLPMNRQLAVRYLGIEIDDAIEIAEKIEV